MVEGFRFDSGYLSPKFITDERRGVVRYENPLFFVTDAKLESVEEMLPVLEVVSREGRPLIIVAEEVEGQALAALVMNSMRGSLKVAAVKAPRYGEERRSILEDLATVTGATFVSKDSGLRLKDVKLEHLGSAKKIEISKYHTTMADGATDYDALDERVERLKAQIEETKSLHEAERMQERITRLSSAIAVIRIGGATEIEVTEKKHRVEDALEAVRSAQEDGVVPGGGTALLKAANNIEIKPTNSDQLRGAQALIEACLAPITQILKNAEISSDIVVNVRTEKFEDLIESGVIDPAKTVKCALRNAASAAGTLLTTNCAVLRKGGE